MLEQKSREWGVSMWIATVDFVKAFGMIHHVATWRTLARFEVDTPYISLLKKLHTDQHATFLTDKRE